MKRFTHLEQIRVSDVSIQSRFRALDQQSRAFAHIKIAHWLRTRHIDEPLSTNVLVVAAYLVKLKALNYYLTSVMQEWRRDSAVGDGVRGNGKRMDVANASDIS